MSRSGTSGKVPCNDRVRCAKRTLPWASDGRELARKCAPGPKPFPGICDKASAIGTPPCRPVRLKVSELTGLGWRNGGEGRSSAASRKDCGAPLAHHTSRGGLRGWRKPPFVFPSPHRSYLSPRASASARVEGQSRCPSRGLVRTNPASASRRSWLSQPVCGVCGDNPDSVLPGAKIFVSEFACW